MVTVGNGHDGGIDELVITAALVDEIVRHCERALPNEGCGLLGGRRVGRSSVASRLFPGTNTLASPSRFAMDPAEVLAALAAIDRDGDVLIAIVHSHPTTAAVPSMTDLREAFYPEALLMIVSLAGAAPRSRTWRVASAGGDRRGVSEVPIRVVSPR